MTQDLDASRRWTLSSQQRRILESALGSERLGEPDEQDRSLYVELWRAGLLRVNGEPGFQLSRLGRESLGRPA